MANFFKNLTQNDVSSIRSVLNELVPVNGEILWNTYGTFPENTNVKNTIPTKMFVEVYDAPLNIASANKIMDVALLVHEGSSVFLPPYQSSRDSYAITRKSAYKSLALRHLGVDSGGNVSIFMRDGDTHSVTNERYYELIAISFSRLMVKDGIKRGSFKMRLSLHPIGFNPNLSTFPWTQYKWDSVNLTDSFLDITDFSADSNYFVNSLVGDYAVLYTQQPTTPNNLILYNVSPGDKIPVGLIFYKTGTVFLNPYLFAFYNGTTGTGLLNNANSTDFNMLYNLGFYANPTNPPTEFYDIFDLMSGYDIAGTTSDFTVSYFASALFTRIYSIEFQNTIELNSTVYFCRVGHNEFNYSSNPTYLDKGRIRVKQNSFDPPVSYITGIGLYDKSGGLLAVAKLSEPVKKSTDVDLTFRVRLDF